MPAVSVVAVITVTGLRTSSHELPSQYASEPSPNTTYWPVVQAVVLPSAPAKVSADRLAGRVALTGVSVAGMPPVMAVTGMPKLTKQPRRPTGASTDLAYI